MNLTRLVNMKEKVAISKDLTTEERDFILSAITVAVGLQNREAVHLMLLRGDIARPTVEQIRHIYQGEL